MQTLEELHRRIDNAGDMQSVVSSMKVLAVVSIRQFEKSLASLNDYSRAIELGLQAVLQQGPPEIRKAVEAAVSAGTGVAEMPGSRRAAHVPRAATGAPRATAARSRTISLILGSEQGLSGQFNEQIVNFAMETMDRLSIPPGQRRLVTLGDHAAFRLNAMNMEVERSFAIQGSVDGMTRCVREVFMHIGSDRLSSETPVLIFHNKPLSGAHYRPHMSRLLPIDVDFLKELAVRPWPAKSVPMFTMDARQLFRQLIRQHIRIMVERSYVESLLSENTSRLLAMQVAEKNIGEYLEELKHDFNNRRQGEITAELLDIVAGSEALSADYC
ncbi:MAG: F0F1 ATP synthase subunit gamma [Thermoleophilia bacterium]|nr:F0F1 ATP synthase subunit gamma [Thermoleophilia bacterium]